MKAIKNFVLIKIDVTQKEKYALTKDVTIQIIKGFSFNLRVERSSMGYVIDGEGLPHGSKLLINYLGLEPTYHVPNYNYLTEEEVKEGYKVINIPKDMAFAYNSGTGWIPCEDYLITLRIFKPYKGLMTGIEPQIVKNRMFVVAGYDNYDGEKTDLSGLVAVTTPNCDYHITYHDTDNKQYDLMRSMNREIEAIDYDMTEKLNNGELLIGYSPNDCKTLKNEFIIK